MNGCAYEVLLQFNEVLHESPALLGVVEKLELASLNSVNNIREQAFPSRAFVFSWNQDDDDHILANKKAAHLSDSAQQHEVGGPTTKAEETGSPK